MRWLNPKCKRVRNFKPIGSNTLYKLLGIGRINDDNLFLKIAIDSESLIVESKLNQSFMVEGKKEFFKHSVQQWNVGKGLFLNLVDWWHFGIIFFK